MSDLIRLIITSLLEGQSHGVRKARSLDTDTLKRLWDSYDGTATSDEEISGEAVHRVLNERGEGSYCAV